MVKSNKGVGICGISKAAEIALCMAAALPSAKMGAVALLNGPVIAVLDPVYYQGKLFCEGKYS